MDKAGYPLVSVIIPAYNYARFLAAAIDSVRQQDYPHIEIIVIDDGSTDDTPLILSKISNITYIRQENQGLSAARNHGIQLAHGKYLQFLDADDLLGVTSIRKRVDFLEQNPDKSAVICRSAYFSVRPYPERYAFLNKEWRQPDPNHVDLALCYFNIAPPHAFLIRKSEVDKISLRFDPHLRACEDYDFWFRLAQRSGVPGVVRSCWVYYRQHKNSMSRSYVNQYQHDAELCKRVLALMDDSKKFFCARPMADYLFAMLAASLLTARRLWRVDRSSFDDFTSWHIMHLQRKLCEAQRESPPTAMAHLYLALSRLHLLRMWFRDHSLNWVDYDRLCDVLPSAKSYFVSAISRGVALVSLRTTARLLKFDVLYAALLLRSKLTRKRVDSKEPFYM
ncbi:glycosyltransferase [Desulfoferrobacter suflitae]|uniref:glycosyltransferase n=1 Tax=Desulfoferrobacter suflitae TaxID=2865782 RepID=UPI002164C5C6|nr:glycosyltransferase [Desulfoferrobacter suflitae]MCK8600209.1 glycosyltransferase [Desulfoferrobacter suflitae]